jgi:hypothetical protein
MCRLNSGEMHSMKGRLLLLPCLIHSLTGNITLSRKEIQKRKAREAISLEKNWEMHSRNYNKEVVMLLTGLNEKQADDFMIWFNGQNVLPYTATEYEVRAAIRDYFMLYAREKGSNNNSEQ